MGHILEALTRPEKQRSPVAESVSPELHCVCQSDAAPSEPETGEEVPFIEVGGRKSMEASASVLASPAPSSTGPRLVLPPAAEGTAPRTPERISVPQAAPTRSRLAPELVAYHRPDHAVSQQYQRLLGQLLALAPERRAQVVLFSAARPACGTTTALLNVAITAARYARQRVVVVDGNLRRPGVADRLGLAEVGGLREVLGGGLSLQQALRETDQVNLFALTAGKPPGVAGPLDSIRLVSETVRSLLRQLRQRFDLVLVDGPRWDGQQDVLVLGAACDAVYLVVAEGEAESVAVDDLYQTIPEQGGRLAGCILAGC